MHMPLLKFLYPGNVMTLISTLIPVVGFDVMEQWMDWEYLDDLYPGGLFDFEFHE